MKKILFIIVLAVIAAICFTGCGKDVGCRNGHTPVVDHSVEATCTSEGLTAGSHCEVCGEILVAQTVVPKKEHKADFFETVKEPTQTENGVKHGKCKVCGNEFDTFIPYTGTPGLKFDEETGYLKLSGSLSDGEELCIPSVVNGQKVKDFTLFLKQSNNVKSVRFPHTARDIVIESYENAQDEIAVDVDENNPYIRADGNCLIRRNTETLIFGNAKSKIPSSVKTIGEYAFLYRESLTSIVIPEGVEKISENAFYECLYVDEIVLPESLIEICSNAFEGCGFVAPIEKLVIPKNVKRTGCGFVNPNYVKSVEVEDGNQYYFMKDNCLIEKATGKLILYVNDDSKTVVIPEEVRIIGDNSINFNDFTRDEIIFPRA